METFFSVVIPVYNKEKQLERAIESVLTQSYFNYEIIIVDDGSTDNSLSIARKFEKESRIQIVSQINGGVSVARNTGIQMASGECITFLDPDDRWKAEHLMTLNNIYCLCKKKTALYSTCFDIILTDGSVISEKEKIKKELLGNKEYSICNDLFKIYSKYKYGIVHTNSIMIPKRIFEDVGMFTIGCKRSQDIDMWFRILLKYPAIIIGKVTTEYYRNESTATATETKNFEWPFFDTADFKIKNDMVRTEIKDSLKIFLDEVRISMAKHLVMYGKREQAIKMLNKIYLKKRFLIQILNVYFLFLVPSGIIKKVYYYINRKYLNI